MGINLYRESPQVPKAFNHNPLYLISSPFKADSIPMMATAALA